ncbi:MAG: hypothetical protein HWE14_08170 [Flavobacteriia bacterium]|nr:hypothetical protein [Flavobacteriia bacterium]
MKKFNWLNAITYIARAWALIIAIFAILAMFSNQFGITATGVESQSTDNIISFIFFPLGTVGGLMWAWKKELQGGIIALVSMVGLIVLSPGLLDVYWMLAFILLPIFLFVWIGYAKRNLNAQ